MVTLSTPLLTTGANHLFSKSIVLLFLRSSLKCICSKVGNLKKVIRGVDEGIRGMKVGGVRRLSIPPSLAFVEGAGDNLPGPMPAEYGPRRQIATRKDRETWYFEIQVTKVR